MTLILPKITGLFVLTLYFDITFPFLSFLVSIKWYKGTESHSLSGQRGSEIVKALLDHLFQSRSLSPSFHLLESYPAICLQLKSQFLTGSRQIVCFTWVTSLKGIPPDRICRTYSVAALTSVLAIMESMSIMSSSIRFSIQASHSNFRDPLLKCNLTHFGRERVP